VTETIASKILNTNLPVQIYLPPCHDAVRFRYPALYLIQGTAFYIGEWMEDGVTRVADLQIHLGIVPPFIIVMPASDLDRGGASKYHWSTGGKGSWEDFILTELLPVIESKYGAWDNREGRAIGGISRGGYWSLQIAFANPDIFGIVGGHSPSITSAQLIGTPANFSMLSFVKSPDGLRNTRIWLDAGDTDWARIGAGNLSRELEQRGITHTLSIGSGGHTDDYWASRMPDYVTWYALSFPKVILADSTRTTP
jgi:enterochelin esterase-like enzyme